MIANPRFDAGRFRAAADDTVGILLEEGIGGQLAGFAAGGAEEVAVDVISSLASAFMASVENSGSGIARVKKINSALWVW
jgi:hypothetical protein